MLILSGDLGGILERPNGLLDERVSKREDQTIVFSWYRRGSSRRCPAALISNYVGKVRLSFKTSAALGTNSYAAGPQRVPGLVRCFLARCSPCGNDGTSDTLSSTAALNIVPGNIEARQGCAMSSHHNVSFKE